MPVPESIRRIERPKNTIVYDNGQDGPKRYAVRERKSVKYVPGGNPQPQNGKVIGHIIGDSFVPLNRKPDAAADMLSYGAAALVKSVSQDILDDLLAVYPANTAYTIMAIATLRILKPTAGSNRLSAHYTRTFVCRDYPGAALSKNSIGELLQMLGRDGERRKQFYIRRIQAVASDHHIAIDGTLKQDNSVVNDLSAFSYKSRIKGCRDVSVIYAYDIELMEPICAEVFPGNCVDVTAYPAFIRDNDIHNGIIVSDKGFPPSSIYKELEKRPDLHFLTPIRRNDSRIQNNSMLEFERVLEGVDRKVLCKKRRIKDDRILYAFKDVEKSGTEDAAFISRAKKKSNFDPKIYAKKNRTFGVIVFESDCDVSPEVVFLTYEDRWLLELVFRFYKGDACLDRTNVQGDFSVIGSEFINFIATVAICRMIRKAQKADLFKKISYGELMDDLASAWRKTDAPFPPASDDEYWVHTLPMVLKEMEILGLSIPAPKPEPRRRGRPPKCSDVNS